MECLVVDTVDDVEYVTLNRPKSINALDDELTTRLKTYFESLPNRAEVRVVVLKGFGRGFCSGLDLKSEQTKLFERGSIQEKFSVQHRLGRIILAMRRCPQPIVTVMHGITAGGGFCLAMASDIRIAARDAKMNAAFVRIGLGGGDIGASYLLPRIIGAGPAYAYLLTGRTLDAERAYQLGFLAECVEEAQLDHVVQSYVTDLLATGPLALRMTKEILNANIDAGSLEAAMVLEDRNQVLLSCTGNFSGACKAFLEKRPFTFTAEGDGFETKKN